MSEGVVLVMCEGVVVVMCEELVVVMCEGVVVVMCEGLVVVMCEGVVVVMCEGVVVVMCEGVVVVMCEGVVVVMCGCSGSAALYTQVLYVRTYVRTYILLGSFINCLALPIRMYVCTHFGIESCRNVQFESFFSLFTIYMLCIHKKLNILLGTMPR